MTDVLLIVADALLLAIALIVLFDLVDRRWPVIQGTWLRFRRWVFKR